MNWDGLMWPNYGTPSLQLVSGQGSQVTDAAGHTYTDLLGGIAVNILGHAHPNVVAAVSTQIAALGHTSNLYAHPQALALAAALQAQWPDSRVFFSNSGAEANEAALKLIRRHAHATGRPGGIVLAFDNAFHGRTAGTLALTHKAAYKDGCGPLVGQIVHVPFDDIEALQAAFAAHEVVGVFTEMIQGEGGIRPISQATADALQTLCKQHDALLCVDEIQTGIGRTGTFFAFQQWGIHPDIVTLAKGLGGGLPIGATLTRSSLARLLGPGLHGSTFGGNPVACAAANAVLSTIETEGLLAAAASKGAAIMEALAEAGVAARGKGLLIGIDVPHAGAVVQAMQEVGFLVGQAGPTTVRLAPALNVPDHLLATAVGHLIAAIQPSLSATS